MGHQPLVRENSVGIQIENNRPRILNQEDNNRAVSRPLDRAAPILILSQVKHACRLFGPQIPNPQRLRRRIEGEVIFHPREMLPGWRQQLSCDARQPELLASATPNA